MLTKIVLKKGNSYYIFEKYIAENGNIMCAVDDEVTTREAGNEFYKELKTRGAVCTSRKTWDMDNEEIADYIKSGIDRNVEYIDDGKRYFAVKARNDKLWKLLKEFRNIAGR